MVNIVESAVKVILAVLFVYMGFKVEGAFGAIVVSILIALFVGFLYAREMIKGKVISTKDYIERKEFVKFILPTFVTTLALISIFTTDVILVRHFFPGVESGYYSALSVLGKIIFFASSPVVLVLFPMVSEHHARGENYNRLLSLGLILTLAVSLLVTFVYFTIPELMIKILFGDKYLAASNLLGLFGVFMVVHALCNLFANFYLSIHKTMPSFIVAAFAFMQIFLLFFMHNSLSQVIWVSVIVTFLLLISLLLYYPHAKNK
jgi:O-antigen/teichoic acid export membrane protein